MDYLKQLEKIDKIIATIPYKKVYIEIHTETDTFTLEKENVTKVVRL